jgi:hypothetical protein
LWDPYRGLGEQFVLIRDLEALLRYLGFIFGRTWRYKSLLFDLALVWLVGGFVYYTDSGTSLLLLFDVASSSAQKLQIPKVAKFKSSLKWGQPSNCLFVLFVGRLFDDLLLFGFYGSNSGVESRA